MQLLNIARKATSGVRLSRAQRPLYIHFNVNLAEIYGACLARLSQYNEYLAKLQSVFDPVQVVRHSESDREQRNNRSKLSTSGPAIVRSRIRVDTGNSWPYLLNVS